MKYFIGFHKKKAIYVEQGNAPTHEANVLANQINVELSQLGYIFTKEAMDALMTLKVSELENVYMDLIYRIKEIIPNGDDFKPLFKDFPNVDYSEDMITSVNKISKEIENFYTTTIWNTTVVDRIKIEAKIDLKATKQIGLLTKVQYNALFNNILTSPSSLSEQDIQYINWAMDNDIPLNFNKIRFNETLGIIGANLFEKGKMIDIKDATSLMRIWATYSGGDPGLKENVKFKSPSNKEKKILLNALDKCYNLEEAFKINREKWLRILFYLHPMTKVNEKLYPNVYKYSKLLRNSPKELKTFNGHIESGLANKDIDVLDLLATRMGVYTRRLDHTVRVFGVIAVSKWLAKKPTSKQLIDAYNHFYGRDKADTRTAILAGSGSSDMVSYKALKPLTTGVIDSIRENILVHLKNQLNGKLGKVYIDPLLYLRSFVSNNRAASISIGGTANGTIVSVDPTTKVLRMYCMWEGSSDIDLSCWAFGDTMTPVKVGFAGTDNWKNIIKYSGDNTGRYAKNSEYIDIKINQLPSEVEWVVNEAHIYSGKSNFAAYKGKAFAGMMSMTSATNSKWVPTDLTNSIVLGSKAKTAYLQAYHVPSNTVIFLDVSHGSSNVSNADEIVKFKPYLDKLAVVNTEVNWDIIKQGHVLELAATKVVEDAKDADVLFGENTISEEVENLL